MNHEIKRINKTLLISWLSIIIILLSAYSIEVIKGERTLQYILMFAVVMIVPIVMVSLIYFRKPDFRNLGYYVVLGYSCMYVFVMFTGSTQMVSSYILPLLCFLVLYHRPALIMYTFVITLIINTSSLIYQLEQNSINITNSKDVEIRFAVIIVSFAGGFVSAKLYDSIYKANEKYTKDLAAKNDEIQEMAIQTIATIANTIDAKDEYTKGHSKRVAEYSAAIAEEIGMDADNVRKIKSIALLHDIGKIGVPDSVLNKPGKLTNDEYELMKQHTVTGAEILKDIGMFPGIDIGAKYHHERYDGNGYPERLSGEEIPEIARIIAVADAFDAMTSSRVYRKQLDMDHVMEELKRCRGTQFDPKYDDVLIKLVEEKRVNPVISNVQNSDVSDVSKIWSRVIEKDEEKFKDKSLSDEITGLYGRKYGEKLIKEAVENQSGALLVVDVDHFRRINGEGGFLLGDIFLRTVASCIDKIEYTKVAARYGGDEFTVFIPNLTNRETITEIAENLRLEIRNQNEVLRENINLTVSIGIRICDGIKNVYQDMFLDADRALYLAKRHGGDCCQFFEKNFEGNGKSERESVDLLKLRDTIRNPERYGKYIEESPEFHKAYDLIKNVLSESKNRIQVILFTTNPNEGVNVSLDTQDQVMDYLEKAIARSIKGRDYTLRYSGTQRMIILMDSREEGARAVSSHIMREFYKLYDKKEINVSYNMIEIS